MTDAAQAFVATIAKLRSEGKIGNSVAMLSVADQFGIGLAKAARKAFKKGGFDLVYDRAYPVETQDMRAIMTEVKRLNRIRLPPSAIRPTRS
jgi:branched-chain amino acid transport system substrate-binding protein